MLLLIKYISSFVFDSFYYKNLLKILKPVQEDVSSDATTVNTGE